MVSDDTSAHRSSGPLASAGKFKVRAMASPQASPIEDGRLEFRVSFINGKPYVSLENAEEIEAALSHTIRVMREALERIAEEGDAEINAARLLEGAKEIARSALGASIAAIQEQSK